MMSTDKYISKDNLFKILDILKAGYKVYVPISCNDELNYVNYDEIGDRALVVDRVRQSEPIKTFFTSAKELVYSYFKKDIEPSKSLPVAIVGVKACDLYSLKIQDYVYLDEPFKDPIYQENRSKNLIISCDCNVPKPTCFCSALGRKPYPEEMFDLNLSPLEDGFIVRIGSEKGEKIFEGAKDLFGGADRSLLNKRDSNRLDVIKKVEDFVKESDTPPIKEVHGKVKEGYTSSIWMDESSACVECGACNMVCPTCHCFLLFDEVNKDKMERYRIWDSCLYKTYARVAGGANPRRYLHERLRNRFEKKFDFFPDVLKEYACTGCGRCIEACPGKIDIRKVLRKLVTS